MLRELWNYRALVEHVSTVLTKLGLDGVIAHLFNQEERARTKREGSESVPLSNDAQGQQSENGGGKLHDL